MSETVLAVGQHAMDSARTEVKVPTSSERGNNVRTRDVLLLQLVRC